MARGTNPKVSSAGPRRAGLLQERSRRTRHELVQAALALWTERGFENGIDGTTAEEIAQAAGVTKGTFYFHFAHKEDILLEMWFEVAEAMTRGAELGIRRGRPAIEILYSLMSSLAGRTEKAPRALVVWSVLELGRRRYETSGLMSFSTAFAAVAAYAVENGELPSTVDPKEFGAILEAVAMDTITRWAMHGSGSVRSSLMFQTDLVFAGTSTVYADKKRRRSASLRALR